MNATNERNERTQDPPHCPPSLFICTTHEATMSIPALPSFTPQIINAQGANPFGAAFSMPLTDPGNQVLASIQQFSQLMQPKPAEPDEDTDEASL
jgi:hypothetical protein